LPRRWLDGKGKLDLTTPLNFVSTADTIGGNSGSPVLNRAGELVGINFDRNRHGLVRNFVYTDEQARHISVHCRAVVEVLRNRYGAEELVREAHGKAVRCREQRLCPFYRRTTGPSPRKEARLRFREVSEAAAKPQASFPASDGGCYRARS